MSFWSDYLDLYDGEEQQICCPFPHRDNAGHEFYETNPSCSVKLDDGPNGGVFNCFACGRHGSISEMVAELLGCRNPKKMEQLAQRAMKLPSSYQENNDSAYLLGRSLGFSDKVMKEVNIGTVDNICDPHIVYPVMFGDYYTDLRIYNPKNKPKVLSQQHAIAGQIIPWSALDGPVIVICEGEKDMMMARTHGLNACTLTGGAGTLCLYPALFKGKRIRICYDNDDAGRKGAVQLANQLLPYAAEVKVITAFHAYVGEKGDIYDFLSNNSVEILKEQMRKTPIYTPATKIESEFDKCSLTTLEKAPHGTWFKAKVQCSTVFETSYEIPLLAEYEGRVWSLETHPEAIINLIEPATEKQKQEYFNNYFGTTKDNYNEISFMQLTSAYKATVADMLGSSGSTLSKECVCTFINTRLDPGKNYLGLFKYKGLAVKGNAEVLICKAIKPDLGFMDDMVITENTRNALDFISDLDSSVEGIMEKLTSQIQLAENYEYIDHRLIDTTDLTFNSPLTIPTKHGAKRGCLDSIIVGESRGGKSSTSEHLIKTYGLGTKVSIAGASATPTALVGGSQQTGSGYKTRAGVLPRNNKGLVVFEEFGKAENDLITHLTEVRSSSSVVIVRVSGEMRLEAKLRMLALTNPKRNKSIASHANGLEIIHDLISKPEDIARYDLVLITQEDDRRLYNRLPTPIEIAPEILQERIRWVWTRTPEQIIYTQEALEQIETAAEVLDEDYRTHYQIISGNETWLKVQRLATACAARCASHSEDYSSIVVDAEHVSWAYNFLNELYDNDTFKLKETAQEYKAKTTCTDSDVALLEKLANKKIGYFTVIDTLYHEDDLERQQILELGMLTKDDAGFLTNRLVRWKFAESCGNGKSTITTTEKFRKAYKRAKFKGAEEDFI